MYRFLLAPRWLAVHAGTLAALVVLGVLGRWQFGSWDESRAAPATPPPAAPVALGEVLAPGATFAPGAAGRAVSVTGRWDAGGRLLVPGRRLGDRTGFLVLTPLVTAGGVLVVARGWVPAAEDPAARDAGPPGQEVAVTGVLAPPEEEPTRGARVVLPEGQAAAVSPGELLARLPYPPREVYDGYLALSAQTPPPVGPAPLPVPAQAPEEPVGRLRNLSYALQWWLFAGAAVFFWWSLVRSAVADRRRSPDRVGQP